MRSATWRLQLACLGLHHLEKATGRSEQGACMSMMVGGICKVYAMLL
jgi:hypothetical protein